MRENSYLGKELEKTFALQTSLSQNLKDLLERCIKDKRCAFYFPTTSLRIIFATISIERLMPEERAETQTGLGPMCQLFLSDINNKWNVSTNLGIILQYNIL